MPTAPPGSWLSRAIGSGLAYLQLPYTAVYD